MKSISVIIPVRNRPDMLQRAVRSVLAQTCKDYILIVVDDGSDADMREARQLVEESGNYWIQQNNRGVSAARNVGIQHAPSKWYAFLDSDDEWLPEKLAAHVEFHETSNQYLFSQSLETWFRRGVRVNQKKIHAMPEGDAFIPSLKRCCISPSSVFMHHTLFERFGLFDEQLPVCEDYDLWLRITAFNQIGLVRRALVLKYGGHSDQLSRSRKALDRYRVLALLKLLSGPDFQFKLRQEAIREVSEKLEILRLGAGKHMPRDVALYEEVLEKIRGGDFQEAQRCMQSLTNLS